MNKWQKLLIASLLVLCNCASAQWAEVTGTGEDSDSALNDAKRNAVEQIVGSYISSETITSQYSVLNDEIYAKSVGFVTNIQVLDEGRRNGLYYVHANINVNTNPDSELMNQIAMIKSLGDPRIGVVVFKNQGSYYAEMQYDDITEEAVNDKLINLGFNNVVDTSIVAKLRNSELLNSIYNGKNSLLGDTSNYGIDVLVLVKSNVDATRINIMRQDGTNVATQLIRGNANITGKVITLSNAAIKGTFTATGQGIDISDSTAINKALQQASGNIAQEVEKILRKKAAKAFDGIQIIASSNDYGKIEELVKVLKSINGVQSVYIREYNNGKAIIDVESTQKPHIIFKMLQTKSRLGLFNDGISGNNLRLVVS